MDQYKDLFYDKDARVPCPDGKKTCFAYAKDGTCECLANTDFNKPCPFFCNRRKYRTQIEKEMTDKRKNPSFPF